MPYTERPKILYDQVDRTLHLSRPHRSDDTWLCKSQSNQRTQRHLPHYQILMSIRIPLPFWVCRARWRASARTARRRAFFYTNADGCVRVGGLSSIPTPVCVCEGLRSTELTGDGLQAEVSLQEVRAFRMPEEMVL